MSRNGPAPSRLRRHQFAADPTVPPDRDGQHYCTCGAIETHIRHTLPDTDPDTRALTARMTGDKD